MRAGDAGRLPAMEVKLKGVNAKTKMGRCPLPRQTLVVRLRTERIEGIWE
jgi:hypothetical protein